MENKKNYPKEIFSGFITQFDVEVLECTKDMLRACWHVRPGDLNSADIAHGGASFSVADALCAVLGYEDRHVLTKSSHFYYYYPIEQGDVEIICCVSRKGSFTSLMEVELIQNEKVCMKGFFDMAKMKEKD